MENKFAIISASELETIIENAFKRHYERPSVPATITEPPTKNDLLTALETSQLLKISLPTVWSWKQKGILPFKKVSRTVRFYRNDVLKILENRY